MILRAGIVPPGNYWLRVTMALSGHLIAEHPGTVRVRPEPHRDPIHAITPIGDCVIRGIQFEGFDWAIDCATQSMIGRVEIDCCDFFGCNRAINGWQSDDMQRGPTIDYLSVTNCRVMRGVNTGFVIRNRFQGVLFEHNLIMDTHGPGIMVGNNLAHEHQEAWQDAVIRKNTLVRMRSKRQTIGIQAYGIGHVIDSNLLAYFDTDEFGTSEGIYVKMMHGLIRNNVLINAGGYEAQVACKGSAGEQEHGIKGGFNRVVGNEIHRTGRVNHRPHDRAVMIRADRDTIVGKNLISNASVLIKSRAVDAGTVSIDNQSLLLD